MKGDRQFGLPPLIVRALRARGAVTPEEIDKFLHPSMQDFHDPFLLPDMDKAVRRIQRAISKNERICIFGDYDVDGICATAMLVDYFRSIGVDVLYHIPSRKEEGYGMNITAVNQLRNAGVDLIITVDNGISAADEVHQCRLLGIDVIVTDHHIPPAEIPVCDAVVCHTVENSLYPKKILCGTGVAFKLLQALAGLETAMSYVSLAGLATIADVVPLIDENRALVKFGLEAINSGKCLPGLTQLLVEIPTAKKPYDVCTMGFSVAPRLNAAGRMSDASLAVRLFLSHDRSEILSIIAELNHLNELRQQEEADIFNSALSILKQKTLSNTHVILLRSDRWNPGVIGIAASRISELYHRPTILFSESDGMLKGSARSIDGINIHEALCAVSEYFDRFGGHSKAAGITMQASHFDRFSEALEDYFRSNFTNEVFIPRKRYEFDISLSEIDRELVRDIELLAPFGEGNPSLVFHASNVQIMHLRRFGSDSQHMRMDVKVDACSHLEGVWFASASNFYKLMHASTVEMLFTVGINNWNGMSSIQLRLSSVNAELPANIPAYVDSRLPQFCSSLVENCSHRYARETPNRIQPLDVQLTKLSTESLCGVLILVFTVDGANRIIAELAENNIKNVEIHYNCIPNSPLFVNTILIAPFLGAIPRRGFDRIIFYDTAPTQAIYGIVADRCPESKLFINADVRGDASVVAQKFDCSRDFMVSCYKAVQSMLNMHNFSFCELVSKLAAKLNLPQYLVEFAICVFFELDFIVENEKGSISMAQKILCRSLNESPLYVEIKQLASGNEPEARKTAQ